MGANRIMPQMAHQLSAASPRLSFQTFTFINSTTAFSQRSAVLFQNKNSCRQFSSPRDAESDYPDKAEYLKEHKTNNTKLKRFYLKVHPDLFHNEPEYQQVNQSSIQLLNNFLDAIEDFICKLDSKSFDGLPSPLHFKFVYRHEGEVRLFKTSIFIPMSAVTSEDPVFAIRGILSFQQDAIRELLKIEKHAQKTAAKSNNNTRRK